MERLKTGLSKLKPEFFFLICAFVFGSATLIITPPFQSPDEINHLYRIYQISEGNMGAQKENNRVGGYVPKSFVELNKQFAELNWNLHAKTSYQEIRSAFALPINVSEKVFIDFPNTAMYSPVCYLPQVVGVSLMRPFKPDPLLLFYSVRFIGLFVWIVGMFTAIRLLPFYRWIFVLFALLPMSVFIHMSVSADTVTNVLSFITIAYILRLAYASDKISLKNYLVLCLLTILLASAKIVYTPLILLILLVPKAKFSNLKSKTICILGLVVLAFGVSFMWSVYMNTLYLPYKFYNPEFRDSAALIACADMHEQLRFILDHTSYMPEVMLSSLRESFDMYFEGYIGTFGWLDTKFPWWFIWLAYAIILICLLIGGEQKVQVSKKQKVILAGSAIIICALILLTQHLTWDCVGSNVISTIQGRYFIPVFP